MTILKVQGVEFDLHFHQIDALHWSTNGGFHQEDNVIEYCAAVRTIIREPSICTYSYTRDHVFVVKIIFDNEADEAEFILNWC